MCLGPLNQKSAYFYFYFLWLNFVYCRTEDLFKQVNFNKKEFFYLILLNNFFMNGILRVKT